MSIKLETDGEGNFLAFTVTQFELRSLPGIGLLLVIEYAESPERLESNELKTLQTVITIQQAFELSDTLHRGAKSSFAPKFPTQIQ